MIFYVAVTLVVLLLADMAIPQFVKSRTTASRSACPNNLRQIDGAKEQWAPDHKKTQTDIPTWDDLVGSDEYIKVQPWCPGNGSYTINNMTQKPP
jgi:competence protein ComGC